MLDGFFALTRCENDDFRGVCNQLTRRVGAADTPSRITYLFLANPLRKLWGGDLIGIWWGFQDAIEQSEHSAVASEGWVDVDPSDSGMRLAGEQSLSCHLKPHFTLLVSRAGCAHGLHDGVGNLHSRNFVV